MINKHKHWQAALAEAVRLQINAPFKYGKRDCCIAAADIVEAMTGDDLMKAFRGKYRSAAGAARQVKRVGESDLLGVLRQVADEHGLKEIAPVKATMGDLVLTDKRLHDNATGQACGVCMGNTAIFPADKGWINVGRKDWVSCFKVG